MKLIELKERVKEHYKVSKKELYFILIVIFFSTLIFGFDDGQEVFNIFNWLSNLLLVLTFITISFMFRLTVQKIYSLSNGQLAEFILWWPGIIISFVLALISNGLITIIIPGYVDSVFMTRHRLGEYRYGFSYNVHATTILWATIGHLIMAILFSSFYYYFNSYSLQMVVYYNLILAGINLLPLPRFGGLDIIMGSKFKYFLGIFLLLLTTLLLLVIPLKIGLIIAIILGTIMGIITLMISA